ncbi:MAG: Trk system potassium transporter TrkA [Xanthomonadales bacterium]|nr:Trk system potassium transporter TrkA [Xanthomonadales bacterium]
MNILILGAGQVGTSVAAALARENNDITVVDTDAGKLAELRDKIDLRTVHGFASHPRVLARAGAEDADLVVAVTSSDEVNIVACEVAASLFSTPTRIARMRQTDYLRHPELFTSKRLAVDVQISPEALVTRHVQRLIEYPGALQVLEFADGRAQLVGMRAVSGGALVGHELRELPTHLPAGVEVRVVAIFRQGRSISPEGSTVLEEDDDVFFLSDKKNLRAMMAELRRAEKPARRIMLAGGGNIGRALAQALEKQYMVKVVERSRERVKQIAEDLQTAIVLVGDCADEDLLREENIDQTDVYCALTNDDEANILSSMLAKRLGAKRTISLINRPAYAELVESGMIDIAVSPQQITLSALLSHVRQGNMARVHTLRRGAAEAIEAVALGDRSSSPLVGRRIDEVVLPPGTIIGGLVRGDRFLQAHHDSLIERDDHVILFVSNRRHVRDVELLFRVRPTAL